MKVFFYFLISLLDHNPTSSIIIKNHYCNYSKQALIIIGPDFCYFIELSLASLGLWGRKAYLHKAR